MMGRVQIARTAGRGTTAVSNVFIDEYMADANDAQLKVYLYLLRKLSSGRPTTVMDIADKFNHTEKDIHRKRRVSCVWNMTQTDLSRKSL